MKRAILEGDPFDSRVRQLVADIKEGHRLLRISYEAGSPGRVLDASTGLIRKLERVDNATILAAMILLIEEKEES